MKGMKYGIDSSGKTVVVLMIDGNKVRLLSQEAKFSSLNGKAMALKVSKDVGGIIADGTRMVKPSESGYPDAVIDTLEDMGIDVVG
jgi:hypothetical protein